MPSPEKLAFFYNPEGRTKSIIINPEFFTLDALRSILWYQTTSADPKDILAIIPKTTLYEKKETMEFCIPHGSLVLTRRLSPKERYKVINMWAEIMKNADHAVISSPF